MCTARGLLLLAGLLRRPGRVPPTPAPTASRSAAAVEAPARHSPGSGSSTGRIDHRVDVPVYDIDGFENSAADVARLHREGRKVICYINVGAWEDFRPDQDAFPGSVLGEANGWEGERWLDIRRLDVLRPLMASASTCAATRASTRWSPTAWTATSTTPASR